MFRPHFVLLPCCVLPARRLGTTLGGCATVGFVAALVKFNATAAPKDQPVRNQVSTSFIWALEFFLLTPRSSLCWNRLWGIWSQSSAVYQEHTKEKIFTTVYREEKKKKDSSVEPVGFATLRPWALASSAFMQNLTHVEFSTGCSITTSQAKQPTRPITMADYKFETKALHAGQSKADPTTNARAVPVRHLWLSFFVA